MLERTRVLVVDDDEHGRDALAAALHELEHDVATVTRGTLALERLEVQDFDAVIANVQLPGMSGVELLMRIRNGFPTVRGLLTGENVDVPLARAALLAGAVDLLTRPISIEQLSAAIARLNARRDRTATRIWRAPENQTFPELIGSSEAMRNVMRQLRRIVGSSCTVVINGESGTGKELVARVLHRHGPRHDGPFVAINCAAVPAELLESELFGHARGAYTGATEQSRGVFLSADGGTLLLDEIAAMPLALQSKLLRAVQERTVRPVGGDRETPFDARIIVATNQPLQAAVEQGTFRRDLWFRLDVVNIDLPPLRDRDEDVLQLARLFLERHGERTGTEPLTITPEAAAALFSHDWPGNVRELENCIEAAIALARDGQLRIARMNRLRQDENASEDTVFAPMETLAQEHMARVLRAVHGNKAAAARILGIDRTTVYRMLLGHSNRGSRRGPSR